MPLREFWPMFDGERLPFALTQWDEDRSPVEQVDQTEAGGDRVRIIRQDKLSISAAFNVTSRWLAKFQRYAQRDSIDVSIFDPLTNAYKIVPMRLRNLHATLIQNSELTKNTTGLYSVSFSLYDNRQE